jgi:hypothetical protein
MYNQKAIFAQATRGDAIFQTGEDPRELVRKLTENGQSAESFFRVPRDELEASGWAPL